jgi:3-mercaptopropionate dioxygenase
VEPLQSGIEAAIALGDTAATVHAIKERLERQICEGGLGLDKRFRRTRPDTYARRLLFRNRDLGYSAVVMTWGPGQGTQVHDHAGIWCVEVVVEGDMSVTQYELEEQAGNAVRFRKRESVHAAVGSAGCLIPPFEHHVLANAHDGTSITLHVYGGEITRCNIYVPRGDGWHERQTRQLGYDAE